MPATMPILLVEDDEIDTEAACRAFSRAGLDNAVFFARDGIEALDYLNGTGGKHKIPQPCIMILDINMPRMTGLELLGAMKQNDATRHNVAFILSTSARDSDKMEAYNYYASGYFLKDDLPKLAELISHYCQINQLPESSRH